MKPVRIGLIGCGWFAQAVHLPILARLPQAEVVAVAESDPERLRAAGRLAPAAVRYDNYQDLLRKAGADAAIICLPTSLHAEASIGAMRQGMHVYLEKPIATNLDQARAILNVWKQARVVGMIGFSHRRNALHRSAKASIQAGSLGRLVGVRSVFSASSRPLPDWKSALRTGGGALLELGSHHFDLVHFYFGQPVRTVYADLRSVRTEGDTAMVYLQLANGLQVQSCFSLCAIDEDRFEIFGEAARLSLNRYRSLRVRITQEGKKAAQLDQFIHAVRSLSCIPYLYKKLFAPWHEPSYQEALEVFLDAVRGKAASTPDLEDGYRSLEIVCAAERAAREGQPVTVH